jgi:hypothetical protein
MATKKIAASQAAQATPSVEKTVTYYPYAPLVLANGSSFLAYTGTPVEQTATSDAPANASEWPPQVLGTTGVRSYFDGTGWAVGPDAETLTLAQLQAIALKKANSEFDNEVDTINSGYPTSERSSWSQQLADSQLVLNGGAASALLSALATARSTSVKDLATKIVQKNEAYTAAYAAALASFQKTRATITDATEIAELPPLTVQDIVFHT